MSRSGYNEDCDDTWKRICWRGAVNSAIKGRYGQAFLKELLQVLDDMPEKRLIAGELEKDGEVCVLGAIGQAREIDMSRLDPEDIEPIANAFNIANALAREIVWENDEAMPYWKEETPEQRYTRMRDWVASQIKS